jgi:murein L,D-transpeptidase YcbB/YkuD
MYSFSNTVRRAILFVTLSLYFHLNTFVASAQTTVSNPAVYEAVLKAGKGAKKIQAFYASVNYKPLWIGSKNKARRKALVSALKSSGDHGLPTSRYNIDKLKAAFRVSGNKMSSGATELLATKTYLQYAHDITSGVTNPKRIDKEIAINRPLRGDQNLLTAFSKSPPGSFMKALAPKSTEYKNLLAEKKRLERLVKTAKSEAKIPSRTLKNGSAGNSVVLLRKKLTAMGYGRLGNNPNFDDALKMSVMEFQKANGLNQDGVAGPGTIRRLNEGTKQKLIKVLVNLERERWMNFPRGKRNIFVNQASYTVYLFDNGRVSFQTRAVIGTRDEDRRTPEFYDEMTYMVINPTWHVPSSIAGKEYLPIIRKDPSYIERSNMIMISENGEPVNPADVDLEPYSEEDFPFSIKQLPGTRNALGRVKFMFPNKFNIYLHDTPSKSLFARDTRAFSHGCVRIQKPLEFAYKLLEKQTSNPQGAFNAWLKTGKEQYVNLDKPVPVYLTYRTVYFGEASKPSYYPDIYGRDKKVFRALSKAGVSLRPVQS